jgi:hypothetical protein
MTKKVSRTISICILTLALIAVFMALRSPNAPLVATSQQAAKSFDDKIASLELGHMQGIARTAHITETELSSELQQSIDRNASTPQGSVVLKAASVHLEEDDFQGVFTLSVSGRELYLTLAGSLAVLDGRLQIEPSTAKLGRLPIPGPILRHLLQKQFDSPEARERFQLPDFIKDVRVENNELLVEAK